ncbi:hypothetical protein ANCCAN_02330 [Ancylostoma caninum]|uniref:Uncharacterized protein n=1 Tax=Ancylostoma caninum TaxID=29170 RepID=A0A368H4Y0_ANCCA|nr:hypothetical protein ANCCAN_02330 [Ancylostoma caninum]
MVDRIFLIPNRSDTLVSLGGQTTSTATGKETSNVRSEVSPVVARHTTAHGYVLASLISDISKKDTKEKAKQPRSPDSTSDVIGTKDKGKTSKNIWPPITSYPNFKPLILRGTSKVDAHVPKSGSRKEKRKMELKRKRRSSKHHPAIPTDSKYLFRFQNPGPIIIKSFKADSRPSPVPSSRSFFPYWTGRRRVFSKVEPVVSPSGKTRGAKVATSETNIWEPRMKSSAESVRRRMGSSESGSSSKPSSDQSQPSPTPPRPAVDVYELRRQVERMRMGQLSRGMKELTSTPKRSRSRSRTRLHAVKVTSSFGETASPRGAVRSLDSRPAERGPRRAHDVVEGRVMQL